MADRESLFSDAETTAIKMARRWLDRYAELDRPPWPQHFGDLRDEMLLANTVVALAKRIEEGE